MKLRLKDPKPLPPCGWRYAVQWEGKTHLVKGTSFTNLVNGIELHAIKNNYKPPSLTDIEDMLCRSALTFDPEWEGVTDEKGSSVLGKDINLRLPVDVWGPPIWGYLHTFGVVFLDVQWEDALIRIWTLLGARDSGCKQCLDHFREWCLSYPPNKVEDALHAAVWSWAAHNNSKSAQMTYQDAALQWGWKPLQKEEVSSILRDLRS